jgi:hypothetical protein
MLRDCSMCNVIHKYTKGTDVTLPSTYHRDKKCLDMIAITDDPTIPLPIISRLDLLSVFENLKSGFQVLIFSFFEDLYTALAVKLTDIIDFFIPKSDVPIGHSVTYRSFMCGD